MNAIQKMIFRNVQVVAISEMAKMWRLKDEISTLPTGEELCRHPLQVHGEIETDWDVVRKIIAENETPELILAAVEKHEFTEAGEAFIKVAVREQCRYAME